MGEQAKLTVWQAYWKLARILIVDGLLFLTVLAFLALGFFGLKLLGAAGYPAEYLDFLEKMHFLGYGAVLFIFIVDLLMKVLTTVLKGENA